MNRDKLSATGKYAVIVFTWQSEWGIEVNLKLCCSDNIDKMAYVARFKRHTTNAPCLSIHWTIPDENRNAGLA